MSCLVSVKAAADAADARHRFLHERRMEVVGRDPSNVGGDSVELRDRMPMAVSTAADSAALRHLMSIAGVRALGGWWHINILRSLVVIDGL